MQKLSPLKKINTILLVFLWTGLASAQQVGEKPLYGKIIADSVAVENVNVSNSRTQLTSVTNKTGGFNIAVKLGDLLIFSAVSLQTKRKYVRQEDLKGELFILKMEVDVTELKEVNVNENSEINAENLRIVPHDIKRYTPAERKVYTAQSGLLDPLLNKMSGRTTMLKKEVLIERNEKLLLKLDGLYEEQYYTDALHIPKDHIKGFQYYIIGDSDFARALESKNKTLTMFYVKRLALDYNEILSDENQN
jgi:hypothetical protein